MGNNPVTETGNLPTLCRRWNRIFGSSFSRHPSIAIIFRVCSSKLMNFFLPSSSRSDTESTEWAISYRIDFTCSNKSEQIQKRSHFSSAMNQNETKGRSKKQKRMREKVVKPKSERAAMSLNFWWFVFLRGASKRQEEAKSLSESDTILSLNKILSSKRGL